MFYNQQSLYNRTQRIPQYLMLVILSIVLYSCKTAHRTTQTTNERERISRNREDRRFNYIIKRPETTQFSLGADNFDSYSKLLEDHSVGIVTNQTGILSDKNNLVDYLVSKTNMDRSNLSLIVARYDYVLRTKILDYYQGILQ